MRINRFIAQATSLSRRAADTAIANGQVQVNGVQATPGQDIAETDTVTYNGKPLALETNTTTVLFNKPAGYVVSREGQGSKTIYDLLPPAFQRLKPIGRLDKDSSGLLLLTSDGKLAHELTHPSYQKEKVYEIVLDKPLTDGNRTKIENGIMLEDGKSKLKLAGQGAEWTITMSEGRNRQIRRTFATVDLTVTTLRRIQFGSYDLGNITEGNYLLI
jgi:23S rRNA pseudouridine2605 synthase